MDGRGALELHAPEPARLLDALVAGAAVAVDPAIADLAASATAATLGLPKLELGTGSAGSARPDTDIAVRFAEQFAADVSQIGDLGAGVLATCGPTGFALVQVTWIADWVPRVRAALDAVFGPSTWPTPGPAAHGPAVHDGDPDLWSTVDAYLRAVALLRALDPVTSELVRLRGARLHDCRLCKSLRARGALEAGAGEHEFDAVDRYETSDLGSDAKAALRLTDALVWTPARVDPDLAAAVRDELGDAATVELVLDVMRNAANKIAVALGADAPHVEVGVEVYDVDDAGEPVYGLTWP